MTWRPCARVARGVAVTVAAFAAYLGVGTTLLATGLWRPACTLGALVAGAAVQWTGMSWSARRRCGCPECARRLWVRGPDEAGLMLRAWARRNRVRGGGPDQLVRCGLVAPVENRPVNSTDGQWARAVLLTWSAWNPGVQRVSGRDADRLAEASRRCGRTMERCELPRDEDELELLLRVARDHALEDAAALARAALA